MRETLINLSLFTLSWTFTVLAICIARITYRLIKE